MIDFGLGEDLVMIQATARKFAVEELRPRLRELEKSGVTDDVVRKLHALGLTMIDVPEAHGGAGLGVLAGAVVHEELAYGDAGAAVAAWSPHLVPSALGELGGETTATWLARFEDPLARGAVAWSEVGKLPDEGFATQATRDSNGWSIDGEKAFVINADGAVAYIVFAQVEPGWEGVRAFVVDGKHASVKPGAPCRWLGLETVRAGSVRFERSPAELLEKSADRAAIRRFFARAQVMTAARQVGLARAAYELALEYTQDRKAFGKAVAHFQAVSFALAEMLMDVESARWMVWRAAVEIDRGLATAPASAAEALVHANDAAWRVADQGVQLLGGAGYIQDFPVEKWLRDTKVLALIGGSDQGAQLVAAGALIGSTQDLGPGLPIPQIQPVVT